LELGAGATGLPGIVAAQLGCFSQVAIKLGKPLVAILSSSFLCASVPQEPMCYFAQCIHKSASTSTESNQGQAVLPGMHIDPEHRYHQLDCQPAGNLFLRCKLLPVQVVITDVDECLEALHENVSANLPCHCTLAPKCLPQSQTAAQKHRPSDTQPCTDSDPACLGTDSNNSMQNPGQPANHVHQHQDNTDSTAQQHTDQQSLTVQATEVLVAELDWARDASALSLPFDVVLLADVVSSHYFVPCCNVVMHNQLMDFPANYFFCSVMFVDQHQCSCMAAFLLEAPRAHLLANVNFTHIMILHCCLIALLATDGVLRDLQPDV